ncbi:MAG: flagellar hook-basal body complex protein FliE [Anaerolineaceae bacterium]|nr:flagellar hook-basal body complex protein FliE [Anaerolineaceae bacterium]
MSVNPISPLNPNAIHGLTNPASAPSKASDPTTKSFGELLNGLNQSQNESDSLMQKLAAGEDVDLHQVMIATEENDVNFRVALAIRDRLVDAYREVMRMNV